MGFYKEVDGNLIELAKQGNFDVVTHGCNCLCSMGSGIAPQMAKAFECDKYHLENSQYKGDPNKLGQIEFGIHVVESDHPNFEVGANYHSNKDFTSFEKLHRRAKLNMLEGIKVLYVVNTYSQFSYGRYKTGGVDLPLDYDALRLAFRKLNMTFKGKHIGLPKIGCGLAGGDWDIVKAMIIDEFQDMDVTYVNYVE